MKVSLVSYYSGHAKLERAEVSIFHGGKLRIMENSRPLIGEPLLCSEILNAAKHIVLSTNDLKSEYRSETIIRFQDRLLFRRSL